jgi:hypothetical protein
MLVAGVSSTVLAVLASACAAGDSHLHARLLLA